MPPVALLLSLGALGIPVVSAFNAPTWMEGDVEVLMWLTALLPAFILTYYKGWRGASTAIAAGMVLLTITQIVLLVTGTSTTDWSLLLAVVVVFVSVSLGLGYFAELLGRERSLAESRALTDPLTSLPNRRHAGVFLEAAFSACVRGGSLSVVMFDLDHFKLFNDSHGHAAGDEILATFGHVLRQATRRMDLSARYGGEEFLSILVNCSPEAARGFAERVLDGIRTAPAPWGRVTASAGIAGYEMGMGTSDILLAAADRALYAAKKDGRDRVEVWRTTPLSPAADPPGTGRGHPGGSTIFVVDDDPELARTVGRAVVGLGYQAQVFSDPMSALALLEQEATEVSVLMVDVIMPGMNGLTLVERVSRHRPELPVLFMSGYIHGKVSWPGVSGATTDFIQKPMARHTLEQKLAEMLSRGAPPDPLQRIPPPLA